MYLFTVKEKSDLLSALKSAVDHIQEAINRDRSPEAKKILWDIVTRYEDLATKVSEHQDKDTQVMSLVAEMDVIVKSKDHKAAAVKQWRDCWHKLKNLVGFDAALAMADVESGLDLLDR